jgi:hypothetical protein
MSNGDLPLMERFTLFFDFLGTSMAASWPAERLYPFLDLLVAIAAEMQTAEDIDGSPQQDGSYRMSVTPEVTVFSDNIVLSYPALDNEIASPGHVPEHLRIGPLWAKFMCQDAIRIVSRVAEMALKIGILIRGGYSFGQLYHQNGVVFGEAMVEAYRLESREAINPRILVSDRIIDQMKGLPEGNRDFLLQDVDRRWHLNYFSAMLQHSSDGPIDEDQARRWKQAHLATIDAAIAANERYVAGKWAWFKTQFERATANISV